MAERRLRGPLVRAVLAGAAVSAVAWALGADLPHVASFGLAAAAVLAVVQLVPLAAPVPWPEQEAATSGAGWHQVALLAGYLGQVDRDPDRGGSVVRRLRALATARLSRAGAPWGSERARELLGADLYDVLDGRREPGAATRLVQQTLTRLDSLEVARPDARR